METERSLPEGVRATLQKSLFKYGGEVKLLEAEDLLAIVAILEPLETLSPSEEEADRILRKWVHSCKEVALVVGPLQKTMEQYNRSARALEVVAEEVRQSGQHFRQYYDDRRYRQGRPSDDPLEEADLERLAFAFKKGGPAKLGDAVRDLVSRHAPRGAASFDVPSVYFHQGDLPADTGQTIQSVTQQVAGLVSGQEDDIAAASQRLTRYVWRLAASAGVGPK